MNFRTPSSQEVLERISRHCPEALSAYLQCINRSNKEGKVMFSRDLIEVEMSESWHKFKNNIKKLARENLLEWAYLDAGIFVTLAEINEDE